MSNGRMDVWQKVEVGKKIFEDILEVHE